MEHTLHAPARIVIVAALHVLLGRFVYDWWTVGPHSVGHAYLPRHDFLLEGAASGICLVLVFPVLLRGRPVQRALAGTLSLVPAILFVLAACYAIRINVWVRG